MKYLPMKSNASKKYCPMFSCGVSFAGICLYLTPGFNWTNGGCFVTFNIQLAPKFVGSTASLVLPNNKCGKSVEAGCDSMSRKEEKDKNKFLLQQKQKNTELDYFADD